MPAAAQSTATYRLGDVKDHVRAAAEYFGPAHGIAQVGGWRASGSVPNSDHPKGLALDFMTRSKTAGDQLAADVMSGAAAWGVKYLIWWRQIWHPGQGWKPYDGPSPHTDHVHVSFKDKPGSDSLPGRVGGALGGIVGGALPSTMTGAINRLGDQIGEAVKPLAAVGKVAELTTRLFLPNNIIRGAAALGGTIFVLIGVWFLSREVRSGG